MAQLTQPLWPELVMLALTLFVFDVALRRIDMSVWFPSVNTAVTSVVSHAAARRPSPPTKPQARIV